MVYVANPEVIDTPKEAASEQKQQPISKPSLLVRAVMLWAEFNGRVELQALFLAGAVIGSLIGMVIGATIMRLMEVLL